MKILWTLLILIGVSSMIYNTVIYHNININWTIIFVWLMLVWYSMRDKQEKINLFNKW